MSGAEALFNFLARYSWRAFVGIWAASGAVLFFPHQLGVAAWAQPLRGYFVGVFILSGAVLLTYIVTTVYALVRERSSKRIDLRIVPGSPLHCNWSVGQGPGEKEAQTPILIIMCPMNFAHYEDFSVIIKNAYLKGTKSAFPMTDIVVEGSCDGLEQVCLYVSPIKAKAGQKLTGRLVFVDQFNDKHVSEKITFSPNTIPSHLRGKTSPNCVFCGHPVKAEDQAQEAQMTAHTTCIWP